MDNHNTNWKTDARNMGRGLLMGGADIIPGVSGGTVALILGIYTRLVGAVSHFDITFLGLLRRREWAAAVQHVDLRFLAALACGILTGVASLAKLMHYLLEYQRSFTLAAFFGLIVASSVLVARMTHSRTAAEVWTRIALGTAAALFAFWLVGQAFLEQPPPGYPYVFLCGTVAICAMILPGISGAYILLILGKYHSITGIIHRLTAFEAGAEDFATLVFFAFGCVIGLITFSKLLRWLLARLYGPTMAILCGFMVGSLRRIWPFQTDMKPQETFKEKVFQPAWPQEFDGEVTACLVIAVTAMVLVLVGDHIARRRTAHSGSPT